MNAVTPTGQRLSVAQIDQSVGSRRAQLERLIEMRNREQEELSRARMQLAALKERIARLDASVARANRSIFLLKPELEGLLSLQQRVRARGAEAALQLKCAAQDERIGGAERRAHPRAAVAVDVTMVSESNFYLGFSEDVSEGGIFVATYNGIRPVGDRFGLVFTLPDRNEPIYCLVEVAWIREYRGSEQPRHGSPGMGLRFVGLSPDDRDAIAAFVTRRDPLFHPDPDDLSP